jgi:site-specific recombinase XerD
MIMALPVIHLRHLHHRGKRHFGLFFSYDPALVSHTRKLSGISWSQTNKCWYLPNNPANLKRLFEHFKGTAWLQSELKSERKTPSKKKPIRTPKQVLNASAAVQLGAYRKMMLGKRYGARTIATYASLLEKFFGYFSQKAPDEIDKSDIERYNYEVIVKEGYSIVYQRQLVSALKLYYDHFHSSKIETDKLERPKRSKTVPVVLSRQEILKLLLATPNLKHRTILAMLYGSGLRISELINLKLSDLDLQRKQVIVRQSKGRKDRVVALSEKIYGLLNDYLHSYRPDTYLFNGQQALRYTSGSVRNFLKAAVQRAGIQKRVTPHTLRHTYATHLIESGVDLKFVQELLGHSKPETTQIYLHISQKKLLSVSSPLDTLLDEAKKEQQLPDNSNINLFLSGGSADKD